MRVLPLEILMDLAGDEAHRVCPCGREAPAVGDVVTCPSCGAIQRWAVALAGRILYPAPRKRPHRRTRVLAV